MHEASAEAKFTLTMPCKEEKMERSGIMENGELLCQPPKVT